jgi:hypothetical protein
MYNVEICVQLHFWLQTTRVKDVIFKMLYNTLYNMLYNTSYNMLYHSIWRHLHALPKTKPNVQEHSSGRRRRPARVKCRSSGMLGGPSTIGRTGKTRYRTDAPNGIWNSTVPSDMVASPPPAPPFPARSFVQAREKAQTSYKGKCKLGFSAVGDLNC